MRIYNLTSNGYRFIAQNLSMRIEKIIELGLKHLNYPNKNFLFKRYHTNLWDKNLSLILEDVPIFLVDSTMSNQMVDVPNMGVNILVPEDKYENKYSDLEDKSIENLLDDWIKEKEMGRPRENCSDKMEDEKENNEIPRPIFDKDSDANINNGSSNNDGSNSNNNAVVTSISDLLGVYLSEPTKLIPRKIFVWVDKVENCAKSNFNDSVALLENVILHELGHALFDVTLYRSIPSNNFSYSKDKLYCLIEEACANAFALNMQWNILQPTQQTFIETFVKSQPSGYRDGWDIFKDNNLESIIKSWLHIKVLFDFMCHSYSELKRFIVQKDYHYLEMACQFDIELECCHNVELYYSDSFKYGYVPYELYLVENRHNIMRFSDEFLNWGIVEQNGVVKIKAHYKNIKQISTNRIAVFNNNKWGIVDLDNQKITNFKYDFIWSFDQNGLCMVRIDKKRGYINEQGIEQIPVEYDYINSFYKNVTLAKHNGKYGVIDSNNQIIVPFIYDGNRDIRYSDGIITELDRSKDTLERKTPIKIEDLIKDNSLL